MRPLTVLTIVTTYALHLVLLMTLSVVTVFYWNSFIAPTFALPTLSLVTAFTVVLLIRQLVMVRDGSLTEWIQEKRASEEELHDRWKAAAEKHLMRLGGVTFTGIVGLAIKVLQ